jgi:hypothetical protein
MKTYPHPVWQHELRGFWDPSYYFCTCVRGIWMRDSTTVVNRAGYLDDGDIAPCRAYEFCENCAGCGVRPISWGELR